METTGTKMEPAEEISGRKKRRLKIAQVAPIIERVPPKKYGGTERVVAALTAELVKRGHDVTLFASGDSITPAKLVSVYPRSLREAKIGPLWIECLDTFEYRLGICARRGI